MGDQSRLSRRRRAVGAAAVLAAVGLAAACTTPTTPPPPENRTVVNTSDAQRRGTLTVDGCRLLDTDSIFTQPVDSLDAVTFAPGTDPIQRAAQMLDAVGRNSLLSGAFAGPVPEGDLFGKPLNTVTNTLRPVWIGTADTGITQTQVLLPTDNADIRWEGQPNVTFGDRHLMVLGTQPCRLQEHISYQMPTAALPGLPFATEAGVEWGLPIRDDRTPLLVVDGQPVVQQVEAAQLPISPLVYRYQEVGGLTGGPVTHALRILFPKDVISNSGPVWPAAFTDGTGTGPAALQMGTRLRLKPSAIAGLTGAVPPEAIRVLNALAEYGAVVADSTAPTTATAPGGFTLSSDPDTRWSAAFQAAINQISIEDFEVVDTTCWQGTRRYTVAPGTLPSC